MKNIIRLSVCTLVIAGIVQSSCKKSSLDQPALGALSTAQITTAAGVDGLLIGAYSALDGQKGSNVAFGGGNPWESSPDNWIYGSVAGGDAHKGSSGIDQPAINSIATFTVDASNGFLNTKWIADYEGVTRANNVLKAVAAVASISAADKANIIGQARFLRGHYYFDLKKMFGNVPYIDETTTNFVQPNTADIWPKIVADFAFAYANLPATQTQVGRVNKWAAGAYLAKTYLYQKDYTNADKTFTEVITGGTNSAGVAYGLTDNYEDNFNASTKNNKETVFAIQQAANDGTGTISEANNGDMLNYPYNSPFGCCGFFQPTEDLANSFRTDATGLPYLDDYNSHAVVNDQGIASTAAFTLDAGNLDPRLDWTVGRRGIPYLDWGNHPGQNWIREQSSAGPYSPKKNVYYQATKGTLGDSHTWAPGNANQVNIIRFADVLLMAAEAKAQLGTGDLGLSYVNQVRARAAKPASMVYTYKDAANPMGGYTTTPAAKYVVNQYPAGYFTSKDLALKAIYFERKLELGMEGHRFFDIVRWGTAQQSLATYFGYDGKNITDVTGAHFTVGKNEVYPIPQAQIDLESTGSSSALKQNPGY
ncbi:RagB/SusD family nutrient uptake outer membrane protein [Mucilaginibacter ginsenosidivorax]|uniref:RagB/SusD family nutrient uptake outer membrane protein n=1 Tax=Mucilaginibacter ginsenosidivorax TaxID=862126 RepID=A0A5B8W743_9SPHI|nr:RagB/SusD family nutrient uptake outer membrane protein [Mucilaginibacter ginsenosidivorax]QEC78712.1 RagB/SusD family nutrient uptake outer membrane protein [Mucilaginibacter ginsenosidivorax]